MARDRAAKERQSPPEPEPDVIVLEETADSPSVEVRIWRNGELIQRELAESAEAAQDIVDAWSEIEGVECEVDDLSVTHRADEILEPSAEDYRDESAERDYGPRE